MPLTPEEQAELAALNARAGDSSADTIKVPQFPPVFDEQAQAAARAGGIRGATLGYAGNIDAAVQHPMDALKALIRPNEQNSANNQYITSRDAIDASLTKDQALNPVAGFMGSLVGGVGLGSLLAPARAASAVGRIAQGTGVGAAFGAVGNPGNVAGQANPVQANERLRDTAIGAGAGGAASAVGEGLGAVYRGGKALLSSSAGLSPRQGEIYAQNALKVEGLRTKIAEDPEGAQTDLRNAVGSSVDGVENNIAALQTKRNAMFAGKSLKVNPREVMSGGPEVSDEMNAIINRAKDQPQAKATEIVLNSGDSLMGATPARDIPESMTIPLAQAQRLKEAAQSGAKFNMAKNISQPLDYEAKRAASAGVARNLRVGMEGSAPDTAPLNQDIAKQVQAVRIANKAGNSNPAGLLGSDSLPKRALLQRLDQSGGSDLQGLSDVYKTGRALDAADENAGFWKGLSHLISRPALRATPAVDAAASGLKAMLPNAGGVAGAAFATQSPGQSKLTPEEQAELDQLNKQATLK